MPCHISSLSAADSGRCATQSVKAMRPPGLRMRKASASARRLSGTCSNASWLTTTSTLASAKRHLHDVAFDDAHLVLQADAPGQLLRAFDARRRQLDAGDIGAIAVREIAGGAAEPGAEIGNARALADPRALRQRIIGGKPAIMILVVREQLFRLEIVEMAAARLELGQNDLAGNRVTLVEIYRRADVRIHADTLRP